MKGKWNFAGDRPVWQVFSLIGTVDLGLTEFNFSGVAPSVNNRKLGKGT